MSSTTILGPSLGHSPAAVTAAIHNFEAAAQDWGIQSGTLQRAQSAIRADSAMAGRVNPWWSVVEEFSVRGIDGARQARADSIRVDGYTPGGGGLPPDSTRQILQRVLSQPLPELTSFRHFDLDTEVQPFVPEFQIHKSLLTGCASFVGPSGEVNGSAGYQALWERSKVRFIAVPIRVNTLEAGTAAVAGFDDRGRRMSSGVRAIRELENKVNWGLAGTGHPVKGILNYPFLPRTLSSLTWNRASIAAAPQTYFQAINSYLKYAMENSDTALRPDSVLFPVTVWNILNEIALYPSGNSDKTIMQALRDANPDFTGWDWAQELNTTGTNQAGLFIYAKSRVRRVAPVPITVLPPQFVGLGEWTYMYCSTGGILLEEPGECQVVSLPTA